MSFFTTLLLMATMMRTTPTSLPNNFHFSNHSHDVIDHSSMYVWFFEYIEYQLRI